VRQVRALSLADWRLGVHTTRLLGLAFAVAAHHADGSVINFRECGFAASSSRSSMPRETKPALPADPAPPHFP
jgi:hypothetical protein